MFLREIKNSLIQKAENDEDELPVIDIGAEEVGKRLPKKSYLGNIDLDF